MTDRATLDRVADGDAAVDAPAGLTTDPDHPALDSTGRTLLYDLVSIPSPTGDECEAAERLRAFFTAHDREAWIDEAGNVRAPADDAVLLTSHVDTVPGDVPFGLAPVAGSESDDATGEGATEDAGDALWGRGSVDATGPLAAMAVAAVETGVSFAGVVGEETDSRGARHLIDDRDEPAAVINGEPSGWEGVALGYRGFLAGTYRVSTDSAHTSRPEPNAVEHAMNWWNRVEAAFTDDQGTSDSDSQSVFESVTTKPVEIDGGLTADGLATAATMDVQFRIPPDETVVAVRERATAELTAGTVEWADPIPPVAESPRTPVGRAFRVAIRRAGGDPRLLRKTGTADVNLYADAWDCPTATYGPGDSALDHAPDERLPLAEFDRAVDVLRAVCERLAD